MALAPLATAEELAVWLGVTFTEDQTDRADAVVAAASTAVRVEAKANWVDAGGGLEDVPLGIAEIVVQVAARMFANPTGANSSTTGPFSAILGALDLTTGEKAAIARAIASGDNPAPGLWALGISGGDFATGTVYLPVAAGGEPMPYLADRDVV